MGSTGPEEEPQGPFGSIPLFGDLAGMLATQGPVNWDVARQMARWLSTSGVPEANVDPLVRVRYEELYRIAEMHVTEATGLSGPGQAVRVIARSEWASETLTDWQPLLEALASALGAGASKSSEDPAAPAEAGPEQMMENLAQSLSPLLLGLQSGSMVGHLSQQAFGGYDLPVPRKAPGLMVVAANVDAFAEEWSLELDDTRLYVAVLELAHHAVLTRPHLKARLEDLVAAYIGGFEPDPSALEARMSGLDPTDMEALQSALGDPEALLGAMQTPAQRETASRLGAAVAAIIGYVDHISATVGTRLVGSSGLLAEALRRRRVTRGQGERFVERLFGLELNQAQLDVGGAFVAGVIERGGAVALNGLWAGVDTLPTPAEITAPGLWLERISYTDTP